MRHLEAGRALQQLADDMAHQAVAGAAEGQLARIGLAVGDELGKGPGRHRGVARDHALDVADQRDRLEIVERIIGEALVEQLVARQRPGRGQEQRIAVGRRADDAAGGNVAARADLVLDDETLAEILPELFRDEPRQHVGRGAGGEGHDDGDRPARPALGEGAAGKPGRGEKRGERRGGGAAREGRHGLVFPWGPGGSIMRSSSWQKPASASGGPLEISALFLLMKWNAAAAHRR